MKIFYISDLHFDYNGKESLEKFLGLLNENDIFIILGDFYNDITKTLVIIDLLEHKKVKGYWVLGNHEYISLFEPANVDPETKDLLTDEMFSRPSNKTCDKFLKYVKKRTKHNKYFKFLYNGISYELPNGWKLIGDTGWTSFKNNKDEVATDSNLYEWDHVSNWDWVKKQNRKFVKFVNEFIKNNKKTVVVTHHPLYLPDVEKLKNSRFESKKDNEILFWFSKNDIVNKKLHDVKFLHGHTHAESYDENNLTYAIGRKEHKNELKFKELKLDK